MKKNVLLIMEVSILLFVGTIVMGEVKRQDETRNKEPDEKFVMEATKGGIMEVDMAKTAGTKAVNPRVKNFAKMMINDHSKANNELKGIVTSKKMNTDLMKPVMDDHMMEMHNKSGKEFDIAYIDMMVNGHNKTIELFEDETKIGSDEQLKAFAAKTLPTLRMHLDSAKAIYKDLK